MDWRVPRWVLDGVEWWDVPQQLLSFVEPRYPDSFGREAAKILRNPALTDGQLAVYAIEEVEQIRVVSGPLAALRRLAPEVVSSAIWGAELIGADEWSTEMQAAVEEVFGDQWPPPEDREEADELWAAFDARCEEAGVINPTYPTFGSDGWQADVLDDDASEGELDDGLDDEAIDADEPDTDGIDDVDAAEIDARDVDVDIDLRLDAEVAAHLEKHLEASERVGPVLEEELVRGHRAVYDAIAAYVEEFPEEFFLDDVAARDDVLLRLRFVDELLTSPARRPWAAPAPEDVRRALAINDGAVDAAAASGDEELIEAVALQRAEVDRIARHLRPT